MKDSEHHSKSEQHHEHHKESKKDTIDIPIGKSLNKLRNNPWIASTFVLAIVLIVVIILNGGIKGNSPSVSAETAAQSVVTFLNSNPNLAEGGVSVVSSVREGELYKITLKYQDQDVPIYATLDGKFLVSSIVPLSGENPQDVNQIPDDNIPSERIDVDEDDDAVLGDKNAPVTIVEFSDYQCPFCRKFWQETLPIIKRDYIDTGKVKLIYRDFPLNFHPMAIPTAIAAECVREKAGDKGYFKFHDKVFEEQNILDGGTVKSTVQYTNDDIKKWAKDLGYNVDKCLDDEKFKEEVSKDLSYGSSVGITGTPGFFVNGILVEGALPYEEFKTIIDEELSNSDDEPVVVR